MPTPTDRPAFIYDDHCPMCRGYTSVFEHLGWAERTAFSTIDATTIADLDMDRARHEIPLHDARTGAVVYGLDGLIPLFAERMPALAPVLRSRLTRRILDRAYWLITYNRRHIVSSPPPPPGSLDCAPDVDRASIGAYVALSATLSAFLAARSRTAAPVALVAAAATALVSRRHPERAIAPMTAAGHVATVTAASALAGASASAIGAGPAIRAIASIAAGARKIALRRWMLHPR